MRRLATAAVAGAAAAMLALLPAAAATADTPVLVSSDGTHFADTLPNGLFDRTILVPGTSRTATLYVSNPIDRPVILSLLTSDFTSSDPAFMRALTLTAKSDPPATATPDELGAPATCAPLLAGVHVAANGTIAIPLTLAMGDAVGTVAQNQNASLTIHVLLEDAAAPATADPCAHGTAVPAFPALSGSDAPLARTGSDVTSPLAIAACLLGAGVAVLVATTRRRREK